VPPSTLPQLGALVPFDFNTCPAVPLAMKLVAPAPVWYGIWLAIPPAKFVAVAALPLMLIPQVPLAPVPVVLGAPTVL
jgi:hypothetical protein